MKAAEHFEALARVQLPAGPVHLAIGMFDGVHRGHQAVIGAAVQAARRRGGLAGVLTFAPHPSVVLRPENPTRLIFPPEVKRQLLSGLGIDFLVEHPFTTAFADTTAAGFVALLKQALPALEAVYVGENFRFGRGREGDIAMLAAAARTAGFSVCSVPRLSDGDGPVSSSRLRALIAGGEIEEANALLGYSYFSAGRVEQGRQLGRTLGFPTLNLRWTPDLAPRHGVYAVSVADAAGGEAPGVANWGLRPTIESAPPEPRLEVHVLAPTRLTYGDAVTVRWLRFLRPERRFDGIQELREQIEIDGRSALAALRDLSAQEPPKSA